MQFPQNESQGTLDVAVSIVTYRHDPEELAILLRSLSASTCSLCITVVDNSETEELREIVVAAGADYLKTPKNIGFGAAHNMAIRKTIGLARYHAVMNPDISLNSDAIRGLYNFMKDYPEVGQAMPAILNEDGTEQRLAKRLPTPFDLFLRRFLGKLGKRLAPRRWALYETRDLDLSVAREIPCLSGCFMFLRTSVLEECGLFDERYFLYMEDVDLCRRVGFFAKTVIDPDVQVMHGYSKGSYLNVRLLYYHLRSALVYFQKWGWFYDATRQTKNRECGIVAPLALRQPGPFYPPDAPE